MTIQEILNAVNSGTFFTTSGTNTYTVTSPANMPSVLSYSTRSVYYFLIPNANTGAATINIDGVGAVNLYKFINVALLSGDIPANSVIEAVYDGTNFQIIGGGTVYAFIQQKINSAAANFQQTII